MDPISERLRARHPQPGGEEQQFVEPFPALADKGAGPPGQRDRGVRVAGLSAAGRFSRPGPLSEERVQRGQGSGLRVERRGEFPLQSNQPGLFLRG